MKRLMTIAMALVALLVIAGCDKAEDDHKGHDHKPGEKHNH